MEESSFKKNISAGLKNVKVNWKNNTFDFLLVLFPILLTIINLENWFSQKWIIIGVILLVSILFLLKMFIEGKEYLIQLEDKKKLEELSVFSENIEQSIVSLPEDYLKIIYKKLKFTNAERISLYTFDKDSFKIAGRFSNHPEFQKEGRPQYPRDKGYISKCWQNTDKTPYFYVDDLPNNNTEEYYNRVKAETDMNKSTIRDMKMKSRCYYVRMITSDGYLENPNGVIVLETEEPNFEKNLDNLNNFFADDIIIPSLHHLIAVNNVLGGSINE